MRLVFLPFQVQKNFLWASLGVSTVHVERAGKITTFRRVWNATDVASDGSEASKDSESLGTDWAAEGVFAELLYSTFSEKYFADWSASYDPMGPEGFDLNWVRYDYGKPGSGGADRQARPKLLDAWTYDSKYDENTVCGFCA